MTPVPVNTKKGVEEIIRTTTCSTLKTLFEVDAVYCIGKNDASATDKSNHYLCRASLMENGESCMTIFLSFDAQMLHDVLQGVYSPSALEDPAVFQDAASEIANIIGSSVKAYLNGNGFNVCLEMPFSYTGPIGNHDTLLHFSTQHELYRVNYGSMSSSAGKILH